MDTELAEKVAEAVDSDSKLSDFSVMIDTIPSPRNLNRETKAIFVYFPSSISSMDEVKEYEDYLTTTKFAGVTLREVPEFSEFSIETDSFDPGYYAFVAE